MTLYNPSIFIRRVRIVANNKAVYDQEFHNGVNVLWGANASGKTTILQFIYFAMGGNTPNWKPIARRCEGVFAELELNGDLISTYREFRVGPNAPMRIFFGSLKDGLEKPFSSWQTFPYSRSTSGKENFSQVFFSALEMPFVPVKDTNVTMFQVLRLVYQNQLTSPQKLFREDDFDSKLKKQTIGDYLCGIFDPILYENQLKLRRVTKEIQSFEGEHRGLKKAIGLVGDDFNLAAITEAKKSTLAELEEIQDRLSNLADLNVAEANGIEERRNIEIRELISKLENGGQQLSDFEIEKNSLSFQISETELFLESLNNNLKALRESEDAREILGNLEFEYCPKRLTSIKPRDDGTCELCKSDDGEGGSKGHRVRLQRELEMQISESNKILSDLSNQLEKINVDYTQLSTHHRRIRSEYLAKRKTPLTQSQLKIQELSERVGWLDRQLEVLNDRFRIGKRIEKILISLSRLEETQKSLRRKIDLGLSAQTEARISSKKSISNFLKILLNSDLNREDSFQTVHSVEFEFGEESLLVNGDDQFAASSFVYLKNCFGLAMLLASLENMNFIFPRILLLDAIEDKGLEIDRIHNFHNLVLQYSSEAKVKHQIILTSQTLSEKLHSDKYVIGERYIDGKKALDFSDIL